MVDAATLSDLSKWLAATSLSHMIQTAGWIIPALQTIHILCVAVLFSAAVLVDLRIWRLLQRDVPLLDVGRRFLPLIWPVVLILLVTGSLLIVGEPAVQCAELSAGDLAQNIGMGLYGRRKELRAQDVSDGVALEPAPDASAIPVHVLQAAVAIV